MNYCAHFFVGKEFETLLEGTAYDLLKNDLSALKYNKYFLVEPGTEGHPNFSELKVRVKDSKDEDVVEFTTLDCLNNNITLSWSNIEQGNSSGQSNLYTGIFDSILTVENASTQTLLNTFIYFPLYKEESIALVENLCKYINSSPRNSLTEISFVSFGDDMCRVIEENCEAKSKTAKNIVKFDKVRKELGLTEQKNHLIFIHDSTTSGLSLGMNREKFTDMLAQMAILMSTSYKSIFPMINNEAEATCIGFSSLYFSEYLFINYLVNKATLAAIDAASVNDEKIDINKTFQTTNEMLRRRDAILSTFLEKHKSDETEGSHKEIVEEIEDILNTVSARFKETKNLTEKAAILAALLSRTDYELFANAVYESENLNLSDLYNEAIEFFITEDFAGFYKEGDEALINPLKELKLINQKILNSSTQIRDLEKSSSELEKLIEESGRAQECFVSNEVTVDDKKFRLLPSVDEEPLQECYEEHEVKIESIDLRGNFSSIKNQGQQGSCVAFTLTSIFEYMMKVSKQEDCDLSEAFLYYNARNIDDTGDVSTNEDSGSRYKPALDSLVKYGIALEKKWPYHEEVYTQRPTEEAYEDAAKRKLRKALSVKLNSDAIKSALSDGYPVAGSFSLYPSFFEAGAYIPVPTQEEIQQTKDNANNPEQQIKHGQHAMVIVGFSDQLNMFLVRNSWGEEWGEKGYCYIPYAYVNNPELFNFAAIITEVDSLDVKMPELREIPALKIDCDDLLIRYYITKAALDNEKQALCTYKKQRDEWQAYFEALKIRFANSNDNRKFVNANIEFHNNAIKELEKQNDEAEDRLEEIKKELNKSNLIAIITMAVLVALTFLGGTYLNKGLVSIHNSLKSSLLDKVSISGNGGFCETLVKWLDAEGGGTIQLSYIVMIAISAIIIAVILYRQSSKWKVWREERDTLYAQIERNNKEIATRKEKVKKLKFKAFAAWTVITNLTSLQEKLLKMYNSFISLINNLRVWYKEVEQESNKINLGSTFTNVSLLSEDLLDKYFNTTLKDSGECDVELCEDIDKFMIDAEFLANFKQNLRNKIITKLIRHLKQKNFSVTEHMIKNTFSDIAISVNNDVINNLERNSNLYACIESLTQDSQVVFAPETETYRHDISDRMAPGVIIIESSNRNRLQLVKSRLLKYNEIVALRSNTTSNKK